MSLDNLNPVDMHEAFKRDPNSKGSKVIPYINLESAVQESREKEARFMHCFWQSPEGSAEEEIWARRAAVGYFVLTSAQLQSVIPAERPIVSERFTKASVELYGGPDALEAERLASIQLKQLEALYSNDNVDKNRLESAIGFLSKRVTAAEKIEGTNEELEFALSRIKEFIKTKYSKALAVFDIPHDESDNKIPAEQVAQLFQRAIDILSEDDPAWEGWHAEVTNDASMDTDTYSKRIGVGAGPRDPKNLKISFVHEVIAHALRAVNGSKTGDSNLEHGLPGGNHAEEGVAVFFATALRGHLSERSKDFYMDISMALGQLGDPVARAEMQKHYLDRIIIRDQAAGKVVDEEKAADQAWDYVNRVYRGSRGDENIGVNTMDISYYHGFSQISAFIVDQLKSGKSAAEVFEYLTSGKFDPLNPDHVQYRHDALAKSYRIE